MDQSQEIRIVTGIPPTRVSDNTAQVSAIIDRAGHESLTWVIALGTLADADATFAVTMDHGDAADLADAAAVPAAELVGTLAGAGFTFAHDNQVRKIGYRGAKRHCRLTISPANNSGNADLAALAILGRPRVLPVVGQS